MRVLGLVASIRNTSPGQRFRIEQWAPILRQDGIEIDFAPFESPLMHGILYQPGRVLQKVASVLDGFRRRISRVRGAGKYDAVYLFREAALLGPAVFERWLDSMKIPIVYDFDDAIFVRYISPANSYLSLLKFHGKTRTICRISSHVMVGNAYLAAYARRYNSKVTIVPTTIDTDQYTVADRRPPAIPTIGWTGSFSTMKHLSSIRNALREVARRETVRLRIIGARSEEFEGLPVEFVPWRAESEVSDLRPIDIGLMPVPDDAWNRGKCGCKALQYMALAIPTICSPVGVNTEIIRDGENGFMASNDGEWIEKITRLLRSTELRKRLGAAGRRTVEEKYSAKVVAPVVAGIFKSLA